MKHLRILFVGQMVAGSRVLQRIKAMKDLGHNVTEVSTSLPGASYEDTPTTMERISYRLRRPLDKGKANQKILKLLNSSDFDIAWIEMANTIRAKTLRWVRLKSPDIKLIWYSEDDMMNPLHRSIFTEYCVPLFDLWVTTKSFNARPGEIDSLGAKRVLFINNSYDPDIHRPPITSHNILNDYISDVTFIGTYEKPRSKSIHHLAANGIKVRVWGNGWESIANAHPNIRVEGRPVYDNEYAMAVIASKINLCFLRKSNRDVQTCRSIEIPAIGGFMLHERSDEICDIFEERVAADYFSSDEELLNKIRFWLQNSVERQKVAYNGHGIIVSGNYRHQDRIETVIKKVMSEVGDESSG
ncbi:MAG: glycosyltransferase [Pseudomonadota bacterium]|nr:glycosyltransferase [Pseudomonadota bacterium]